MAPKQLFKRTLGYLNIPHLTLFLVVGQALVFFLAVSHADQVGRLVLIFDLVRAGEIWRLLTAPFVPSTANVLFAAISLWFFYYVGTALEREWGNARYNLYLLVGYAATVLASMACPHDYVTFDLLGFSLFLAFAQFFSRMVVYVMFVIPVEVRWLALAAWAFYGYIFVTGSAPRRLEAAASLVNFAIFFAPAIFSRLRGAKRSVEANAKRASQVQQPFHVCHVCGLTDKTDPKMEFRYCPLCKGSPGYCANHIHNHVHIT